MTFRYPRNTGGNDPSSHSRREAEVEQPSSCRPCGITFNSWEALHNHRRRHPQHRKTYCDKCTKDFATEDATETHRRLFHGAEQNLPCPHCQRVFPRLGGLIHHIESKQCPAAKGFKLEERVEEKRKQYENWDNTLTRAVYGNTAGDFSLPRLDFSSSGPPTPPLQATRPPQSPASAYTTQAASDTALQPNVLDDTQLTAQSDSGTFFDPNEDLISFDEPEDNLIKISKVPISQQNTHSPQPGHDDLNFPPLGSLSLKENAPANNAWGKQTLSAVAPLPVRNAWTNKPASLSSTANVNSKVNDTKPVTAPIPNAWAIKQPANPITLHPNPSVPVGLANIALANMNATTQAPAEKLEWHPFDPDRPGFDATPFKNEYLGKYKCPYRLCTKSVEKEGAFIQHLKSSAHVKKYQCKKCLNYFATIAALTQHSESQSNRCVVRQSDFYSGVVDEITAGIAAPVGLHPDKTTRYIVNDVGAIVGGMQAQNRRVPQASWDLA